MRRQGVIAGIVGAAAVAALLLGRVGTSEEAGLQGALSLASAQERYSNASEAAATFARIAELLLEDARTCLERDNQQVPSCEARAQAFTLAQTSAVIALRCTQPGIFELRATTHSFLREIERSAGEAEDAAGGVVEPLAVPALPEC